MKRPLKNATALLAADIGSRLLGFVISVYLARVLSPEGFGMISIGLAVLGHLSLVASPGISLLETRNVAASAGTSHERAGGVLMVRIVLAVVVCTIAWGVIMLIPDRGMPGYVTLLYVASLLPMAVSLDWFFQGKEQMGAVSVARLSAALLYGAIVLFTVRASRDIAYAPAGFLIANWGATLILLSTYGKRFGKLEMGWQPSLWWKILKENLPVGLGMFLGQLAVNLPPLAIGVFVTTSAVGQFSAAAKVAFGFLILDRLFNTLFLPMLSRHVADGAGSGERLLQISLKGIVLVMSLVSVAGLLLAPFLVELLFGLPYTEAVALLQLLMPYVFLTMVNSVFVCAVLAAGRTREYLSMTLKSGIVLTAAVILLTYFFGAKGAVLGMVIGEFAAVQFSMDAAGHVMKFTAVKWYFCTSVLLLGMLLLPRIVASGGLMLGITGGAVLVFLAALMAGGVSRQELTFLREGLV
jgi:O-antigen/teichoic acid export membrane protein